MNRRSFLNRCGLAAVGTTLLPGLIPASSCLGAATLPRPLPLPQLTETDRKLLGLLSAYSAGVSFWGSQVFARAVGIASPVGTPTQLRVQVASVDALVTFLRSDSEKVLKEVHSADNLLGFQFMDTAYAVTNLIPDNSASLMTTNAVSLRRVANGDPATAAPLAHETLVYDPTTDRLSDPQAALGKRRVDFAAQPAGGLPTQFRALLHGWLESQRYGLKLGKQFKAFQDELLATTPTVKSVKKVVRALLENIPTLAAAFDVEALRPLFTSPLISASLQQTLGLDVEDVLAEVEKLRAELASGDYADAALWLVALLRAQLQDGTAGQWLDLLSGDNATDAVNFAAFSSAQTLVQTSTTAAF